LRYPLCGIPVYDARSHGVEGLTKQTGVTASESEGGEL
jgi:hypothetical protein